MSSNSSNSSRTGGNTKLQSSPALRYAFTVHKVTENHPDLTDEQISSISSKIEEVGEKYVVSHETGKSGETPHLQGFIKFTKKCRPISHFKHICNWIHWENAKGSDKQNYDYVTKENPPFLVKGFPKPVKLITPDYAWEQEILEILKSDPCDRTIYWYWSEKGKMGKTSFCKYLTVKHGAIALSGKASDMRNGVIDYQKNNGTTPELVLVPIPRSFNTDYLNYEGIENVKDMYFYSGKYEGGQVCGNPPHLFVFANEPPNEEKMSGDRWVVRNIDPQEVSEPEPKIPPMFVPGFKPY